MPGFRMSFPRNPEVFQMPFNSLFGYRKVPCHFFTLNILSFLYHCNYAIIQVLSDIFTSLSDIIICLSDILSDIVIRLSDILRDILLFSLTFLHITYLNKLIRIVIEKFHRLYIGLVSFKTEGKCCAVNAAGGCHFQFGRTVIYALPSLENALKTAAGPLAIFYHRKHFHHHTVARV